MMRFVWLIIWFLPLTGFSQGTEDLQLSEELALDRLGNWETRGEKINVLSDSIAKSKPVYLSLRLVMTLEDTTAYPFP